MAYTPKFKWTDELVMEFANLSAVGKYGIFAQVDSIGDKLRIFKSHIENRKREEKIKRVVVGKRGMNADGSRFYYDCRGIKWTIKRESLDNFTFYIAESQVNESIRDKFLSDIYFTIDKKADEEKNKLIRNTFDEILK